MSLGEHFLLKYKLIIFISLLPLDVVASIKYIQIFI